MKKKQVLSLVLALVMMVGVFAPAVARANTEKTEQKKNGIVIHKIVMPKDKLDNHTDNDKYPAYTGGKINNIIGYFGDNAKEVAGVAFDIYMEVDGVKSGENQAVTQPDGTIKPDDVVLGGLGTNGKFYKLVKDDYMSKESKYETLGLDDGTYIIVEDKEASTYVGAEKELLAASKAIPTKITLPQAKPDGTGNFTFDQPLHLYPKNTEEKPVVDKEINGNNNGLDPNDVPSYYIGQEIPYKVDTIIKAGTEYKTLRWTDEMVNGLDFETGSIKVEYGVITDISKKTTYTKTADLGLNTDYTVTESIRGFTLKLTDTGLGKVQDKNNNTMIRITYKGVLNESAKIDTNIPNTVHFEYGNNPSIYDEPLEGNPNGKKIVVNKSWADGPAPDGVTATFNLYEKETGKLVKTIRIVKNPETSEFKGEFTELDNEKTYIVVEDKVEGYLPEYKEFKDGVLTVVNKKNPNPDVITPEKPNVITHGKKFVKTSDSADNVERLAGAEFVITSKDKKQFLALKDIAKQTEEGKKYTSAQTNYEAAIKELNTLLAIKEEDRNEAQKNRIGVLQNNVETVGSIKYLEAARNKAYEALNMQWTWTTEESKAYKFISDEEGRFEVKGLAAGTYHLKEVKAPEGYALPTNQFVLGDGFTVGNGTYTSNGDIGYNTGETNTAKKVINKKVTIPQTGGIGTAIFAVTGVALMGGAVVAMRRGNKEEEEI